MLDIARRLATLFQIKSSESVRFLVFNGLSDALLCDLNKPFPYASRVWCDPTRDDRKLSETHWSLADGDMILVQDVNEPLRVVGAPERSSSRAYNSTYANIAEYKGGTGSDSSRDALSVRTSNDNSAVATSNSGWGYGTSGAEVPTSSTDWANNSVGTSAFGRVDKLTSYSSYSTSAQGIKIKTRKDRQKELQSTSESNLLSIAEEPYANPVEKERSGTTGSTAANRIDDDVVHTESDQRDFVRSGGYALFDDIV